MHGLYLISNQAEPLMSLGEWAEADEMTVRALRALPEGVFAATLRPLRAELCALRGRYDDAEGELRDARRAVGATNEVQYTQPIYYVETLIALGRGDLSAARDAVAAGLTGAPRSWQARYAGRCCGSVCAWRPRSRPGSATRASRSRPTHRLVR